MAINGVTIRVKELEQSMAFYRKNFGLRLQGAARRQYRLHARRRWATVHQDSPR